MNIVKYACLLVLLCGAGSAMGMGFINFFAPVPAPFFPVPAPVYCEEFWDDEDDCYYGPPVPVRVRRFHRVRRFAPRPYAGFGFCAPVPGFGVSLNFGL